MSDFMATGMLPDHYEQLAKTVRDFAQSVVAPVAAKHDEEHSFPYEVVSGMADMGLFGLPFPEEYGGMGGDYFALCLALEELGKVDQSVAITLEAGVSLGAMPVYRFGTEAQKQEWLLSNEQFSRMDAVKNRRFVRVTFSDATPGIRNIATVRKVAEALYPEKFSATLGRY